MGEKGDKYDTLKKMMENINQMSKKMHVDKENMIKESRKLGKEIGKVKD